MSWQTVSRESRTSRDSSRETTVESSRFTRPAEAPRDSSREVPCVQESSRFARPPSETPRDSSRESSRFSEPRVESRVESSRFARPVVSRSESGRETHTVKTSETLRRDSNREAAILSSIIDIPRSSKMSSTVDSRLDSSRESTVTTQRVNTLIRKAPSGPVAPVGPPPPPSPWCILAASIGDAFVEVKVEEAPLVVKAEDEYIDTPTIAKNVPYVNSHGYFSARKRESWTMVCFPSRTAAERAIKKIGDIDYTLGLLLFDIPVILTTYRNIGQVIKERRTDRKRLTHCPDVTEDTMTEMYVEIDHLYKFPIILEDSIDEWYKYLDYSDKYPCLSSESVAFMLESDVDSHSFTSGKITFRVRPTDIEWEAFRILYYTVKKCDPIKPLSYPATLYRNTMANVKYPNVPPRNPWSGEEPYQLNLI